jgi:hypothetical protein
MKGGGQPRYYSVYSVVGPLKRKNALSLSVHPSYTTLVVGEVWGRGGGGGCQLHSSQKMHDNAGLDTFLHASGNVT